MSEKVFDRETLLDLTVNVIPFAILVMFFGGYLLFNPWGFDSVISGIQLAIIAVSGLGLLILTYYSGAAVSKAEKETEEAALEAEETAELESGNAAETGDEPEPVDEPDDE